MSYIVGHPIKRPEDFYGRLEQKKRFYEIISGPQAQSITILGTRRSGKTSFLRHVAHPEVMAQHLKEPDKYIMVYIDVSACRNPSEFYQRTITKLMRLLPPVQEINLWKEPERGKVTMFHLESILCQFPDKRIILMLDEFDKIRKGAFNQDFLTELRALASVWEYELACITASFWDLYQLGADVGLPPTSPFYNIFYPTPIHMDGESWQNLRKIVRSPAQRLGVPLNTDEVEQIVAYAGTLPFFAQATASSWVHDYKMGSIAAVPQLFTHLISNLSSYFAQWWQQFSDIERDVLQKTAVEESIEFSAYSAVEVADAVHWLKSFAFLVENEGQIKPNGEIFRYWLENLPGKNIKRVIRGKATVSKQQLLSTDLIGNGDERIELLPIYNKVATHFKVQDLHLICFELGIDEECLSYQNKQELVKELVLLLNREGRMPDLVATCQRMRPNLSWEQNEQQVVK